MVGTHVKYLNRDLYYKTFYSRKCCRNVISQSVCHRYSLPPQSNICRQGLSLPYWSLFTLMVFSQLCLKEVEQGGSEWQGQTLSSYDKTIRAVKSLTLYSPGAHVIKLFTTVIYHHSMVIQSFCVIKLYCLGIYHEKAINYLGTLTQQKVGLILQQ